MSINISVTFPAVGAGLYAGAVFLLFLFPVAGGYAQDEKPVLSLPVSCAIEPAIKGSGCWLQTLVDHDTSDKVSDFMCSARSYNALSRFGQAHQGTDIGVFDWASWPQTIPVLASAPGSVIGIRDGLADRRLFTSKVNKKIRDQACGNGVSIDHGGGWVTQYCHMREGSVSVKVGDKVARQQKIGLMGVSGLTTHPHLHFQLMKRVNSKLVPVDPFSGTLITDSCDIQGDSLWDNEARQALDLNAVELIKIGFTIGAVTDKSLVSNLRGAKRIRISDKDTIKVFAYFAGSHTGDYAEMLVTAPDGRTVLSGRRTTVNYRVRQWVAASLTKARRFKRETGPYNLLITVKNKDGVELARGVESVHLW